MSSARLLVRRGILAFACVVFPACDALTTVNPENCVQNPGACDAESVCNPVRAVCQPRVLGVLGGFAQRNENLRFGFSSPGGVFLQEYAGAVRLFVADTGNHRVLIWNTLPTAPRPPDVVLGQPAQDTSVDWYGGVSNRSMSGPNSMVVIGGKLIVSDTGSNRLLIWNTVPTQNYQPADLIWGQRGHTGTVPNGGLASQGVQAFGVSTPAVSSDGQNLIITDTKNHRVLIFDGVPASASQAPLVVLGQADLESGALKDPPSADSLASPQGTVAVARSGTDGLLFVPDSANHRVLGYRLSSLYPQNGMLKAGVPATVLLGQATYADDAPTRLTTQVLSNRFNNPGAVAVSAGRLWVLDTDNARVAAFDLAALLAGNPPANALMELGQPGKTDELVNGNRFPTARTFFHPRGISVARNGLAVADTDNHRVLVWPGNPDSLTSPPVVPASIVLGQPLTPTGVGMPTSRIPDARPSIDGFTLNAPTDVKGTGNKLVIADSQHNRVLIWTLEPGKPTQVNDVRVLGQSDVGSVLADDTTHVPSGSCMERTKARMSSPMRVAVSPDGGTLYVSDRGNHRILIWDGWPATDDVNPSRVWGQKDLCSGGANRVTGTYKDPFDGNELSGPVGVLPTANEVFVADTGNHRVLVFAPTTPTGEYAHTVIGQLSLAQRSSAADQDGLNVPLDMAVAGNRLFVADSMNNRVLGFPMPLPKTGAQADMLLGDADFLNIGLERSGAYTMANPRSLLGLDDRLLVADSLNHRVLTFVQPLSVGQSAAHVFGQPNFDIGYRYPNNPTISEKSLNVPTGIYQNEDALFIADTANHRILVLSRWL